MRTKFNFNFTLSPQANDNVDALAACLHARTKLKVSRSSALEYAIGEQLAIEKAKLPATPKGVR